MKSINFIFLVHESPILKHYPFFNIGEDHYYFDYDALESTIRDNIEKCYLPANRLILDMIKNSNGKFKASFAITGLALEVFEKFAPEVLDSFIELARTGNVEFLATPYSYSLASVFDGEEFKNQVLGQTQKIEQLFGHKPKVFFNSAMIYSDEIGERISKMGFRAVIVENAKHIMGGKSPHYVYNHPYIPKLKLLIRDTKLSDDINYRFSQCNWSEFPLTAEKFMDNIYKSSDKERVFNIMFGYEAIGIYNNKDSGIFDFFGALPYFAIEKGIDFGLPHTVVDKNQSVGSLSSVYQISWVGEDKSLAPYCGNELQSEALNKLYRLATRVNLSADEMLRFDWYRLQDISHFFCMANKNYQGDTFSMPYESQYAAFMNYMNVLSDFIERVGAQFPSSVEDEELNSLLKTISNQNDIIARQKEEIRRLKAEKSRR